MKKTVILTLLFCVILATTAASATVVIDLTTTVGEGNRLTITGKISSAERQVTIKVTNPTGHVDYVGQTTSNAEGAFLFSYIVINPSYGIYKVSVGADGMLTPHELAFVPFAEALAPAFADLAVSLSGVNEITISGRFSAGPGQQVTLKVIDPHGSADDLNQVSSNSDSSFAFAYVLTNPVQGIYRVELGGEGVLQLYSMSLFYDDDLVPFLLGDVNGDGVVNAADIVVVNRHALGLELMTCPRMLAAADVNGDGHVNAADVVPINRHTLGMELLYNIRTHLLQYLKAEGF